ncbi:MAG: DNA polymerase III subunit delta [Parvularculaceae bacterium]|nr:DNA polymerase III subunit delta [Parvularculaceae bacterium]
MTALKGKAIDDFLKAGPGAATGAVLIYGPDAGLARERAEMLARRVVTDLKDPFNYIELSDSDLKGEPGRLADEAAALSFAGGQRVVRYRASGEAAPPAVATLIELLEQGRLRSNALVIIEGGDLSPRSGLRALFEKAKAAIALPCYVDGPAALRSLAVGMARAEGLTFDDEALDLLVSLLGEDRALARSEIEKLLLYKGPRQASQRSAIQPVITKADIRVNLVDGAGDAADEAADAAADGDARELARALFRSATAGASPISLLRALWRQFARLKEAQSRIAEGASHSEAMKKLRPPVFFAEERAFEARLRRWPGPRLDEALALVLDAELSAKTTGAPQREISERAALQLAMMQRSNPR